MSSLVVARFYPRKDAESAVEAILRGMVTHTRREPGCQRYDFYRSATATGERIFCLIEAYADDAAIQAHRETEHYKQYRATIMDLLAQPIDVVRLEALDVREG